jgi:ABC-type uncharacterized transport system ATPase subunit
LSDRVAVMCDGRIVAMMTAQDADRDQIGLLMGGSASTDGGPSDDGR